MVLVVVPAVEAALTFVLFFAFVALLVMTVLRFVPERAFHPPFTLVLIILAMLVAWMASLLGLGALGRSIEAWQATGAQLIMLVLLPPILFDAAFSMRFHVFRRIGASVLVLAVVGVLLTTIIFGLLFWPLSPAGWGLATALLLAVTVATVDPVAVLPVLEELRAPPRLSTLMDGEALLTDAVSLVIFALLLDIAAGNAVTFLSGGLLFLQLTLGGFLWGLLMAVLTYLWLGLVYNDPVIEISLVVVAVYATFFAAEVILHVSGVLVRATARRAVRCGAVQCMRRLPHAGGAAQATVVFGLFMSYRGRLGLSRQVQAPFRTVWRQLSFFATVIIFALLGAMLFQLASRGAARWLPPCDAHARLRVRRRSARRASAPWVSTGCCSSCCLCSCSSRARRRSSSSSRRCIAWGTASRGGRL